MGPQALNAVDAVAVAHRPGLIGSLLVGVTAAKTLAWALGKPLIGVDHVHAHLYSVMLEKNDPPSFPAVGLVCSGGHTALYRINSWLDVEMIGSTIDDAVGEEELRRLRPAVTPEVAAAVAKLMSNKDLVLAAGKVRTVTRCRNTLGQLGVLGIRTQPNHPADDVAGILMSAIDGLLFGCGDAVIGVNPATDAVEPAAIIHRLAAASGPGSHDTCNRLSRPGLTVGRHACGARRDGADDPRHLRRGVGGAGL